MLRFVDKRIVVKQIVLLGQLLSENDITKVNQILEDTTVIYKDIKYDNNEVKTNIIKTLNNKNVILREGWLYLDSFISYNYWIAKFRVIGWVEKDTKKIEVSFTVIVKRNSMFGWRITEIQSNDDSFGYVFVDSSPK